MPRILSNKTKEMDKMHKRRRLDEYNSSDLKSYIIDQLNESSIDHSSQKKNEYIDPTLNLL